jgi:hypothetical protein
MSYFRTTVVLFFTLFLASCAIQVAPEGGPKDLSPPHLISSEPEIIPRHLINMISLSTSTNLLR